MELGSPERGEQQGLQGRSRVLVELLKVKKLVRSEVAKVTQARAEVLWFIWVYLWGRNLICLSLPWRSNSEWESVLWGSLLSLIAEVEVLQRQMSVPWHLLCLFQDTDVIVWDVINESGLYRLRGHKDAVTQVLFLKEKNLLVTRWARLSVVVNQESSLGFTCVLDILGAAAICVFLLNSWYLTISSIFKYGFVTSTYLSLVCGSKCGKWNTNDYPEKQCLEKGLAYC